MDRRPEEKATILAASDHIVGGDGLPYRDFVVGGDLLAMASGISQGRNAKARCDRSSYDSM
jgi:hypothetical protein